MTTVDPRTIEQDKAVDALIERKKALEVKLTEKKTAIINQGWLTNSRNANVGNLQVNVQIAKLPQLIELASYLVRLKNDWIAGAEVLGLSQIEMAKNPPLFQGEPVENWLKDIVLRRKKSEITDLEKKVSALNSALEEAKSEVQKRQDSIKKITELLDDE